MSTRSISKHRRGCGPFIGCVFFYVVGRVRVEEIDFIRTRLLDLPLDVAGCAEIELRSKIMAAGPLTLTERNE